MELRYDDELPNGIRNILPQKIRNIYRETFSRNFPHYRRDIQPDSEQIAHEAAWKAVKERFEFVNGEWIER